jgi:hypothetical protein
MLGATSQQESTSSLVAMKKTPKAASRAAVAMKNTEKELFHELMVQNSQLEAMVRKLKDELKETTTGIIMRGSLWKWKDHVMTFASKWGLRYFILHGTIMSYYNDETDTHPRKTFDLKECVIVDEGIKGNYRIFSICLQNELDLTRGPQSGSLLRLSSDNLGYAQQWIDMLCRACDLASSTDEISSKKLDQEKTTDGIERIVSRVNSSRSLLQVSPCLSLSHSITRCIVLVSVDSSQQNFKDKRG